MLKIASFFTGILFLFNLTMAAKDYNGAELFSRETIKYGRFDIRMRAVSGSGIISSFFTYYNESYLGSPEPWREIDVEVVGKKTDVFQSNIITGTAAAKTTSEKFHTFANLAKEYHTYSVEWTPEYITWFFDGTEIRRSTGQQVTDCQQKEMSYRFNLWISDVPAWAGQFNPSILPVYQFINWVKYSKYTPGSGSNGSDFTPEWQDDFDAFNTNRWAKGDWTFDGNLVDFSPENIVVKEGYCIIGLTKAGATGFNGDVPKDQMTSILNGRSDAGPGIFKNAYPNLPPSFSVSLDGRLICRETECFNRKRPAVWVTRENNTIVRKIYLSK